MKAAQRSLPSSLRQLLAQAPSDTATACIQAWDDMLALQDSLSEESERGVAHEPAESAAVIRHVTATLDAEEARWRDGAVAMERKWHVEREGLVGWWRADDSALLHEQMAAASLEADRLQRRVRLLPGTEELRSKRAALRQRMGITGVCAASIGQLCEAELTADVCVEPDAEADRRRIHGLMSALGELGGHPGLGRTPLVELMLVLLQEGAAAFAAAASVDPTERAARQDPDVDTASGLLGIQSGQDPVPDPTSPEEVASTVRMAAACFLLSLADSAASPDRLRALLPALAAHRSADESCRRPQDPDAESCRRPQDPDAVSLADALHDPDPVASCLEAKSSHPDPDPLTFSEQRSLFGRRRRQQMQ